MAARAEKRGSGLFGTALTGLALGLGTVAAIWAIEPSLPDWFGLSFKSELAGAPGFRTDPPAPLELAFETGPALLYAARVDGVPPAANIVAALKAEQAEIQSGLVKELPPVSDGKRHVAEVRYAVSARAGDLISLSRTDTILRNGQGAPQISFATILLNEKTGHAYDVADFFTDGDLEVLTALVCPRLQAAKIAATGRAVIGRTALRCPEMNLPGGLAGTPVVLAASTAPDRIGGLVFRFAPGKIGPPEEGSYSVMVEQSAFAEALKPAIRPYFAGEPLL